MELKIDVVPDGDTVSVSLTGEIDFGNVAQLRAALIEASGIGFHVVVDLAGVSFVDSMALGVLVQAKRSVEHDGGRFVVRNSTPPVRRVLSVAGIEQYLLD